MVPNYCCALKLFMAHKNLSSLFYFLRCILCSGISVFQNGPCAAFENCEISQTNESYYIYEKVSTENDYEDG